MSDTDWLHRPIDIATSSGGVRALRNPWDGLIRGDVAPWPPPELFQKLYQSRQSRAFHGADLETITAANGFYSDLQSLHSEDALTWSLFGPLAYARPEVRAAYVADLLTVTLGERRRSKDATVWLWRRLPHPDTLVPGGPEIDFGIQTEDCLVLGEAKWRSSVGAAQGAQRSKDQIQLRVEFCEKYGAKFYPGVEQFVVLFVSPGPGGLTDEQRALDSSRVRVVEARWRDLGGLESNPHREEFLAHLAWRHDRSQGMRGE